MKKIKTISDVDFEHIINKLSIIRKDEYKHYSSESFRSALRSQRAYKDKNLRYEIIDVLQSFGYKKNNTTNFISLYKSSFLGTKTK